MALAIITDIDGTATRPDVRESLERLAAAGAKITAYTGRELWLVPRWLDRVCESRIYGKGSIPVHKLLQIASDQTSRVVYLDDDPHLCRAVARWAAQLPVEVVAAEDFAAWAKEELQG